MTGVTIILGLFLWDNENMFWIITGVVVIGILNIYIIVTIFRRIIKGKLKYLLNTIRVKKEIREQKIDY